MRCVSYCTAESYNLIPLATALKAQGYNVKQYRKVLYITYLRSVQDLHDSRKISAVFIFSYGCAVMWGLKHQEERMFLEKIKPHAVKPLAAVESDRFVYYYGDKTSITTHRTFNVDVIVLEPDSPQTQLAISYGLAQSIQLESYETAVQKVIAENAHFPEQLAESGKLPLAKRDILQRIGKIFLARNFINLNSDYLEDPEYFWEHPSTETYYTMCKKYLDIPRRVATLNQKLDVLHELLEILTNQLQHRHSNILEITIILLIVIEIVLSVITRHF